MDDTGTAVSVRSEGDEARGIIDLHSDIQLDLARSGGDPRRALEDRHLPGMSAGKISLRILATFAMPPDPTTSALRNIAATRAAGCRVVAGVSEFDGGVGFSSPGFILGLEGAEPYARDLGLVEVFYWAGVRVVGLSWMHQNWVTGACGEPNPGGITSFGRTFLAELSRFRSIVDLAHISDSGFYDAIELYDGPLMCSHTCARALHEHSRNITDEQARVLAERDGIIGVCFFSDFLDASPERQTVERVADHVEHFLEVAGEDHVGIGPDWCDYAFDLIAPLNAQAAHPVDLACGFPAELGAPENLSNLESELTRRGLPSRKILFENGRRFLTGALPE